MKNIFVGNLDITTTEGQLRELFVSYGTLATVTVVMDRDTGTPRGFAFIEMADDIAGLQAATGTPSREHSITNSAKRKGRSLVSTLTY